MRKLMMISLLMISMMTLAQEGNSQPQRRKFDTAEAAKMMTDRMVKEYGLNDVQAAQVKDLNEKYAGKIRMGVPRRPRPGQDGPRPDSKVDGTTGATAQNGAQPDGQRQRPSREQMESRMKEMKAQKEAYDSELKQILSEEQFSKYEADQKRIMERWGQRPQRNNR